MQWDDYYKILQVHFTAEKEVIEAAYKRLCKKYHPDIKAGKYSDEKMKQLNYAYSIIGNREKRAIYHAEWIKKNFKGLMKDDFEAAVNYEIKETEEQIVETDAACDLLEQYFLDLAAAKYEEAYMKLSDYNKKMVPIEDFIEWQECVSRVFKLGSFCIKFFKENRNFEVSNVKYKKVREFSVNICDKNVKTGKVSEETVAKYVLFENEEWHINLGYDELKSLIINFKYIEKVCNSIDLEKEFNKILLKMDATTGLLNKNGFMEKAELEDLRSQRYGNVFSIVMLKINAAPQVESLCVLNCAQIIKKSIRATDIMGRWGDSNIFILLFTETNGVNACSVVKKLYKVLKENITMDFALYAGVAQYRKYDLLKSIRLADMKRLYAQVFYQKNRQFKIIGKISFKKVTNIKKFNINAFPHIY